MEQPRNTKRPRKENADAEKSKAPVAKKSKGAPLASNDLNANATTKQSSAKPAKTGASASPIVISDSDNEIPRTLQKDDDANDEQSQDSVPPSPKLWKKSGRAVVDSDDEDEEQPAVTDTNKTTKKKPRVSRRSDATVLATNESSNSLPGFIHWLEKMVVRKDFEKALKLKETSVKLKERELELKEREISVQEQELSKQLAEIQLEQDRIKLELQKSEEETLKAKMIIERDKTAEVKLLEARTALALAQNRA